MSSWFNAHTHSQYSSLDGMTPVPDLVAKAAALGYPALGLTDHGNMAGTVQLYTECKKVGILPYPGVEMYLADPAVDDPLDSKTRRFHVGLLARNLKGYKALVKFISLTHTRPRFSRFPRALLSDLVELGREHGDGLILLSGCFFGLVQQRLVEEGVADARRVLSMYRTCFPHMFVEVQNHGIAHDERWNDGVVVNTLALLANELGLPLLATQDNHYLDQGQKKAHELMKRMVYGGVEDEFPGDYFHLASSEWVAEHYRPEVWDAVEESAKRLVKLHELEIPPLDAYRAYVPTMEKFDPNVKLMTLAAKGLKRYVKDFSNKKAQKYWDRLAEEIGVINQLGYSNYFLLARWLVRLCRKRGICIEARGSANGSLVCFSLGVTQVDPIKWEVSYERFVSPDRIKPPDIDFDIEDARRDEVVAELQARFPTVKIGTWAELGASAQDPTKGSVLVSYQSYLRRKALEIADRKPHKTKKDLVSHGQALFKTKFGHVQTIDDVRSVSVKDHMALVELARMKSVYRSYGVHAAGILLGSEELSIEDYVPTMLVASSETRVSQFDMDDVERLGLLKLDILGQATLTVMRICQQLIIDGGGEDFWGDSPTDFSWIPENDRKACSVLREGRENCGIFHFEGYTKAKGGKELGVRSVADAIIASALYMPAAIDSGQKDRYLQTRRDPSYRQRQISSQYDIHPVFGEVLEPTNGIVIYQEQPLDILRGMGFDIKQVNLAYKILKDSGAGSYERNAKRLAELRAQFDERCEALEIEDVEEAWHQITGYNVYGFNKAHSTGYGIRSYRCAYLKAHFPLEFMTALLMVWVGKDKEKLYAREARRLGIRLLPPDVNISGPSWTIDRDNEAVRKGLASIHGIGQAAAEAIAKYAPYKSVKDLAERCPPRAVSGGRLYLETGRLTGKLKALQEASALESIE